MINKDLSIHSLAEYFDHTNLYPDSIDKDIDKLCREAEEYNFYSICVNPVWVKYCKKLLYNANVRVCTVIGFPLGAGTTAVKLFEMQDAIRNGTDELDVVMNIGKLKEGDEKYILKELDRVKKRAEDKIVKIIIETALLNNEEKIKAAALVSKTGCDFIKTSTGFARGGAVIKDILLLKEVINTQIKSNVKIKASGGIQTLDFTLKLIEAGADRIGSSKSVSIMKEAIKK